MKVGQFGLVELLEKENAACFSTVLRSPRMKCSLFLLPALIACSSIGHAGCWAHARRYFFQAVEAHPDDRRAIALVATIDELFAIDAQARNQNLTLSQRDGLRQQLAPPILESIKNQIEVVKGQILPKSALAKACNYTLTLWNRLTCFLDHPILELSTNAAENAIRPVALGRKNWIHFGSQEAGPRIAAILSVVETCRRLQIPLRDYLASILPGLADLPVRRVAALTPTAWVARP